MGSHTSKLSPENNTKNVQGQGYKRLDESVRSNGIDSSNNSYSTQSHKDTGNKSEFQTNQNRITSPGSISCHETNPNQSLKEDRDSRKRHPKDCEIESCPTPDVLDGQQSCIQPSLTVLNDEKDDTVIDTCKKKQNPSKKKKKKKATSERLSSKRRPTSTDCLNRSEKGDESIENEDKNTIRMVWSAPSEPHHLAITTEEVANDSEGTSFSRANGRLPDEPVNIEEIRQEKNNGHGGNNMNRQDRPSSADLFMASSVRTKQNADDIIRQEPYIKIQAMTEEAERVETICKNHHFKHRHSTQDNSLCPPTFLQSMLHIEDYLYDLRIQIDVIKREKNEYLNRLSSVAGSMLTENNPNITDLNDPNRATKLAEKWCKIYDDEWTDALESLEKKYSKKNHEQYVYHLFSLIKVIYKTCRKKAKEQFGIFLLLNNPSSTQVNDMWSQLPVPVRQNVNDSRKKMAEANIKMLQETVIQDDIYKKKIGEINPALNEEILDVLQKSSYFETCLNICWQFMIQDPPLYLDVAPLKGDKLNKDTHKEYTKSGTVIKYVVWPALYLYCTDKKKGPLLSKGVVQPEDLTIDH